MVKDHDEESTKEQHEGVLDLPPTFRFILHEYLFYIALVSIENNIFNAIGSIGKDKALLVFESLLEARINAVFSTVPEETEEGENEKASSKKENTENAEKSKPYERMKEKTKKIDTGLCLFFILTKLFGLRNITPY